MNIKNQTVGSITESVASESSNGHSSVRPVIIATLALWFGLVFYLGSQGSFVAKPGSPPLPIFFGVAIPLAVFFAAYFGWSAFRAFILKADLRFVAAMQGWRWAGLGFLTLSAKGILPALFALPAGLGDMAIGVTAPWIVLGLVRSPSFAASQRFVTWNVLGIVDLVVAISMGVLSSGLIPGITALNGNVTTGPMAQPPLVLIPAYMVPFFIMLHFTALSQAQQLARSRKFGT